jgi:hypothetical protein
VETLRHIRLTNLKVYDVWGGSYNNKNTGLVVVLANGSRFQDVLINGVTAYNTDQWAGIEINGGVDYTTHDVLDGIFTQDIYGTVGGGGNTTDTYRYATINGVKLALPTDGNPSSSSNFVTSDVYAGTYDPASPGTSGAQTDNSWYRAKGTAATGAGTAALASGHPGSAAAGSARNGDFPARGQLAAGGCHRGPPGAVGSDTTRLRHARPSKRSGQTA